MFENYKLQDPYHAREAEKYPNPVPSREYIVLCLDKLGQSISGDKLIELFGLTDQEAEAEALRWRLIAMERDGQLIRNRRGKYAIVAQLELIRGRVVGHKDGFGFLIPDDRSHDLFLSPNQMRALFPGDIVLARSVEHGMRGKREGVVVEILERNTQELVGRYFKENTIAFVQPNHKEITQDIVIPAGEENNAQQGQFVVVSLLSNPTARRQATGRITEILGDHLSPGMEVEVAVRAHNLPHHWPAAVLQEITNWKNSAGGGTTTSIEISAASRVGRKDIRHLPIVTIDGEDAKDFDDGVYCELKPDGCFRLLVAIADVSHYVAINSELDKEAQKRGNSVYFPGRVIPMLPEILSNELCSLQPNVDRLCLVCDMQIDADGELSSYEFYDAVMCSRARLTYDEVTKILTAKNKKIQPALLPYLQPLQAVYKKLFAQRKKRGALDFETTETRIIFSKNKKIQEIVPVNRTEAHKLIEECMLVANVATAQFLEQRKIPALYRVHTGPNPDKMPNLQDFLKSVGLRLTGGNKPAPLDYAKLLRKIANRPDAHLIQTVLLRSLMQAVYSPKNSGHFGLAYPAYTHFTSPIRRYPDLLVHRAIRYALHDQKKQPFAYDQVAMLGLGEQCSVTERRADEATRDAVNWLKCHYMQNKLGQEFKGIITGVTGFGVFVELSNIYIEGLVHITALKNDYYHFDPIKHTLTGKRTGTVYRLGDAISVLIARVDLDQREIHLELS